MHRSLRRRGFAHVCTWNYSPLLTDVARGAADLGAHIERICEQTGHDRVHVVGHSLGGPDRPLLRAAPGRRPPGRVAGHPRDAAPGLGLGARRAHAADPPAPPRAPRCSRSWPSRRRPVPDTRSPRSTATSTRWCVPTQLRAAATTPTCRRATCSCRGVGPHVAAPPPRRGRRGRRDAGRRAPDRGRRARLRRRLTAAVRRPDRRCRSRPHRSHGHRPHHDTVRCLVAFSRIVTVRSRRR